MVEAYRGLLVAMAQTEAHAVNHSSQPPSLALGGWEGDGRKEELNGDSDSLSRALEHESCELGGGESIEDVRGRRVKWI